MASYSPATSFPAWSVDKFAEFHPAPTSPPSVSPLQLPNTFISSPLSSSSLSSTTLPSPFPIPDAAATAAAAAAATQQPHAPPTISTFSTSVSSYKQIHIVQPYLQSENDSTDPAKNNGRPHLIGTPAQRDGRPRRPANAWILYRSDKMKALKPAEPSAPRRTQADISKLIAEMWKNETEEVKKYYETLSDLAKAEHHAQYPTYRFQPTKKTDKPRPQKKAQKAELRAERGPSSRRAISTTATPLKERSVNTQSNREYSDNQLASKGQLPTWRVAPAASYAHASHPVASVRESHPPTEQSTGLPRPPVELRGMKPVLPSLITNFVTTSTTSATASNEMALPAASGPSVSHWPEQSLPSSTFAQSTAHSDRSYAYNSPITTNHEQSPIFFAGWTHSATNYEYSLETPQPPCSDIHPTQPQQSRDISHNPYLDLFTHPGASVEVALPANFDFNIPELGEFEGFDQWFAPGGLDLSAFAALPDPASQQFNGPILPTARFDPIKQEPALLEGLQLGPAPSNALGLLSSGSTQFATPLPSTSPNDLEPRLYLTPPPSYSPVAPGSGSASQVAPVIVKRERPSLSSVPSTRCAYSSNQPGWESYQSMLSA